MAEIVNIGGEKTEKEKAANKEWLDKFTENVENFEDIDTGLILVEAGMVDGDLVVKQYITSNLSVLESNIIIDVLKHTTLFGDD